MEERLVGQRSGKDRFHRRLDPAPVLVECSQLRFVFGMQNHEGLEVLLLTTLEGLEVAIEEDLGVLGRVRSR